MSPGTNSDPGLRLDSLFAQAGGVTGAFSTKAADYVASRPDYPDALFEALLKLGALFDGACIADIGAGTGLFTQGLLHRGYRVTAAEPNAAMRQAAEMRLSGYRKYTSVDGSGENSTLPDDSIDLVTVAQAFHWLDVAAARREFLRILRPAGQVALIWNTRPLDDRLNQAIESLFAQFGGNRHQALAVQQDMTKVPEFFAGADFHELAFAHTQKLDRTGFSGLIFSRSFMPDRDTPVGHEAAQAVHSIFDRFACDDELTVRYRTVAMVGRPQAVEA